MNQVIEYHFPLMFTSALMKLSFFGGRSALVSKLNQPQNYICPSKFTNSWCVCVCVCVQLYTTFWTVAHQAPLSMGFFRQEYRSGLPFPPPGDLPDPELNLYRLHFRRFLYQLSHWARLILVLTQ